MNDVQSYAAHLGIYAKPGRPRSRFTFDWWSVVGPDGWWPGGVALDEVYQALAWALEMSWPERGAYYTPAGLVMGTGAVRVSPDGETCFRYWSQRDPVDSLRAAVQRIVLASTYVSRDVLAWRERIGIGFDSATRALTCRPVVVARPAYTIGTQPISNHAIRERLAALLTCAGRGPLLEQHNQYHPRAVHASGVRMYLARNYTDKGPEGERYRATMREEARRGRWSLSWAFDLQYGYPPPDGSAWTIPLVRQRPNETFVDVMLRAETELARLTAPDPARTCDPDAPARQFFEIAARAARVWGCPSDAIVGGLRFYERDGRWHLDAGHHPSAEEPERPAWRARWNRDGEPRAWLGRGGDVQRKIESASTWAPDWRRDFRTGETWDHEGNATEETP